MICVQRPLNIKVLFGSDLADKFIKYLKFECKFDLLSNLFDHKLAVFATILHFTEDLCFYRVHRSNISQWGLPTCYFPRTYQNMAFYMPHALT